MSFSQNYSYAFQQFPLFNEKIRLSLSNQRIIQKNLVHFQGFPDSLYNENLLLSREYLGQYGTITKIVLVSKEDKNSHKKINSAYITFQTNEQAAYCILSLDSIKINNQIVRAFFGTTKYCIHFLNNFHCLNEERCMFQHHLAEPSDIIDANSKFGYSEHINLAKKIIKYGSIQSKYYISKYNFSGKTVLPNIKTIYDKEDDLTKDLFHSRQCSDLSNSSISNISTNRSNNRNLSESSSKEKDKIISNDNIKDNNDNNSINNDNSFDCYKSKKKSRFFNNINNEYDRYNSYESKNLTTIINDLCRRMSFFNYFKNNNQKKLLKELEINYCINLYKKTNDNEIKLLLENKF